MDSARYSVLLILLVLLIDIFRRLKRIEDHCGITPTPLVQPLRRQIVLLILTMVLGIVVAYLVVATLFPELLTGMLK